MSSDLEKKCPNLTQPLSLCWDQNSIEMISYWILRIGELGTFTIFIFLAFKHIPELVKSFFLFYQKWLDHKLDWRKQADEMKKWEWERQNKPGKRKPPS